MGGLYLLNTNAASDTFSGRSKAQRRATRDAIQRGDEVAMSVMSHAELLFGLAKNPSATRVRAAYDDFLNETAVMRWTKEAASSYAELRLHLQRQRLVVDVVDLLIAAQAHSLGAILVTRDKDFAILKGC